MSAGAIALPGSAEVIDEHAVHLPAPTLRGLVDGAVAFRQAGVGPVRHRGLPSRSMTLIFTLDDPLVLAVHPDPAQPPGVYETLVGGLHTGPALITHEGRQSGIQLGLSPLGARVLLGMPAGELGGVDVPADEVLGPLAEEIQDRLRLAGTWDERFAILDQVLTSRTRRAPAAAETAVSPEIRYAWRRLMRGGGNVSVRELSAETGWSDRHLRARFREETGLAPKAAARVIRFERARRELQRRATTGEDLRLADLAVSCGYFDQAHLDRDFGLLAGCSPTTWLAEEFRNFQSAAA
jgi:AraC-like DNA-binding protein